MELQNRLPALDAAGMALFAISYDPVAVLADFAARRGIAYPLLSDQGSRVIGELGLLNEHLAEQQAFYGVPVRDFQHGIPYPGYFRLDERGIVVEKKLEQSYRVRPSGRTIVEPLLGEPADAAVSATGESSGVRVRAWLTDAVYRPYQQLRLRVAVETAPGAHVYGRPIPEGYLPLTIELEPFEGLSAGPVELPAPHPFRVEGLDERFVVHEGRVEATLPFGVDALLGRVVLGVRVAFQACDERACYPPAAVRLELPLEPVDLIRD